MRTALRFDFRIFFVVYYLGVALGHSFLHNHEADFEQHATQEKTVEHEALGLEFADCFACHFAASHGPDFNESLRFRDVWGEHTPIRPVDCLRSHLNSSTHQDRAPPVIFA